MTDLSRLLCRATALLLFSLTLSVVAFGQQSRITGNVFGSDRRPVPDIYVELLNEVGSMLARQKTGGGGEFSFGGLSSGRFSLRVRPFGTNYEEQTQDVELVTLVGGRQVPDMQQKDIYLRLRKTANQALGSPGTVFAQDIPNEAKRAYERGVDNIDNNRVDAGVLELKTAITTFPDYFLALERLGLELIKQQKFEEARQHLERAVKVNEKSSNGWYGLAFTYYGLDQTQKAVEAAGKAAVLAPNSAEIALILGVSLRKNKQFPEAETAMLNAKKLSNGTLADAHWNLALLYTHNLKKYKEAANELESYLKLKPDHPDAKLLRAQAERYRTM